MSCLAWLVVLSTSPTHANALVVKGRRNVVFLISDDLRPEMMAAYGQQHMITPSFDRLANSSMVFNRAYCQQAICGPTRNSFLSGRRPQRTKSWNFIDHFREPGIGEDWISFPGYFLKHGYTTLGVGKTFHPGLPPRSDGNKSWSSGPKDPPYVDHQDAACTSDLFAGESVVCPDNKDYKMAGFTDYENLKAILNDLHYASGLYKSTGQPFFLNYGIKKPHLPFHFPAEFNGTNIWSQYGNLSSIAVPTHEHPPAGMPSIAFTYEMDGKTTLDIFGKSYKIPGLGGGKVCPFCGPALPDDAAKTMRKGYYSAVSWVDFCVGSFLEELHSLGHMDDTVIALVGDHGWQLGEHNIWGKHTNFELGTRVPLIIRAAGQTQGLKTSSLVESVDIYPTVAALAGLPPPVDVDGLDLSPLWLNVAHPVKDVAFSEYPRCGSVAAPWTDTQSCVLTPRANFTVMGYSVRTENYRATFWMWWDGQKLVGDFGRDPAAVELYDHHGDDESNFNKYENENIADENPFIVAEMLHIARGHWSQRAAQPPALLV